MDRDWTSTSNRVSGYGHTGPWGQILFTSSSSHSSHLCSCLDSPYPSLFSLSSRPPCLALCLFACPQCPFSFSPDIPFLLTAVLACSLVHPHVRAPVPQVGAHPAASARQRGLSSPYCRAALHCCASQRLSCAGLASRLKSPPSSSSPSNSSSFSPHSVLFWFFSSCLCGPSLAERGKMSRLVYRVTHLLTAVTSRKRLFCT